MALLLLIRYLFYVSSILVLYHLLFAESKRIVGSIWYTVGYYSHNIVMDLLAETGIIGTTFFLSLLLKTFLGLYRLMRYQKTAILLSVIFLGTLLKYTFSGYYLGAYNLFMMCSFVYVMNNSQKTHLRM